MAGQKPRRRIRFIRNQCLEYKGNKCERCDYNKCKDALHFHHKDPLDKDDDFKNFKNYNFDDRLRRELDKCFLLCANCHAEVHAEINAVEFLRSDIQWQLFMQKNLSKSTAIKITVNGKQITSFQKTITYDHLIKLAVLDNVSDINIAFTRKNHSGLGCLLFGRRLKIFEGMSITVARRDVVDTSAS